LHDYVPLDLCSDHALNLRDSLVLLLPRKSHVEAPVPYPRTSDSLSEITSEMTTDATSEVVPEGLAAHFVTQTFPEHPLAIRPWYTLYHVLKPARLHLKSESPSLPRTCCRYTCLLRLTSAKPSTTQNSALPSHHLIEID